MSRAAPHGGVAMEHEYQPPAPPPMALSGTTVLPVMVRPSSRGQAADWDPSIWRLRELPFVKVLFSILKLPCGMQAPLDELSMPNCELTKWLPMIEMLHWATPVRPWAAVSV